MTGEAEVLRPLVEECLDDDPAVRPTIATVCERIQMSKDAYIKDVPQECITLYQQVEQQKFKIEQLSKENKQKDKQLRVQMVIINIDIIFVSPLQELQHKYSQSFSRITLEDLTAKMSQMFRCNVDYNHGIFV